MLLAERQKKQRVETPCRCGSNASLQIGTVEHLVGKSQILIHNIPHYYCSFCGRKSYDINMKVTPFLKIAYKRGLKEFDWNQKDSLL
ncbi:YgiT-type zinc finger protein [Bacillus pacificus]|uniref:YgiT-type zinc finger protein n=1 Tax=Bacillus TaxID=1386 RepID=UPI000346BED6|nr:YgiT-type zinc finger protein [Bacillus pacificus]MCC2419496.1 YgiT-type zinc finger protein [Bacillus pacificus]MCU5008546.1 YgiT-type zinc finger protein [Bacillus pacificus]MCU5257814.1 YgiT-type zinc finger protein [Bacillus pacificus]MCU5558300.1 YgiT-type zinc finger protein [Bacillus pacificus]HDR3524450.1 YgiT-type zinc finger protein [Bacillus pacificus]